MNYLDMNTRQMHNILLNLNKLENEFCQGQHNNPRFENVQSYIEYLDQEFIHHNKLASIYYRQIPGDAVNFFKNFKELDEALIIYSDCNIMPLKQFNFQMNRPHIINCFEMIWMYKGDAKFMLNNEMIQLKEGDCLLHPPNLVYNFNTSPDSIGVNILIRRSFMLDRFSQLLNGIIEVERFIESAMRGEKNTNFILFHAGIGRHFINETINNLFIEYLWGGNQRSGIMDTYFELFVRLIRRFSNDLVESPHNIGKKEKYFNDIKTYINLNYKTATLSKAASSLYLSKQYICRIVNIIADTGFTDMLTKVRVEKAKEYLTETNLSLECIAELIGFSSASYLSRIFKNMEGITPSEFRRNKQ